MTLHSNDNIQLGIDGLDDLQIDPMKLSKIKIFAGEGPVSINSSLSKAVVTGFGNTVVVESEYVYDQFNYYSFKVSLNAWLHLRNENVAFKYSACNQCSLNDMQLCE